MPIISSLVSPILKEKEKTFQLAHIIDWKISSTYKDSKLILGQPLPRLKEYPIQWERNIIPPTSQSYLDSYLTFIENDNPGRHFNDTLIVYFGNMKHQGFKLIYEEKGNFSGNANVYLGSL